MIEILFGYFIFDSIDMLRKLPSRQTYEYLLHHIIIIGCFGISVYYGQFIGYCVLSLFLEINSIFLHLYWNTSRKNKIFLINTILNLDMFYFSIVIILRVVSCVFIIFFSRH
ncbi:unnamed protein product [Rotaria sp. Silwood1]|nr:unnamed protein product [Rotaria sp. Silwood1]CAF0961699.1 unnamed protein product [Rotaria sp. Silwood1]